MSGNNNVKYPSDDDSAPTNTLLFKESDDSDSSSSKAPDTNTLKIDLGELVMACRELANRTNNIISTIYDNGDLRIVDKAFDGNRTLTSIQDILNVKDPTTVADEVAQKLIIGSLQSRFPNLRINGEEEDIEITANDIIDVNTENDIKIPDEYQTLEIKDIMVWVDPIDGTKEFTEGIKSAVTTLIGICWKGRPIAGIIGRPFSDQIVWGIVGLGAFGFRHDIRLQNRDHNRRIICTSRAHFNPSMRGYICACNPSGFKRAGGCGGKVLMVIEGDADAYVFPSLGTKKWDTAAPEAILLSLGGRLTKPDGSLYNYEPVAGIPMNVEGFVATVFDKSYHDSYLEQNINIEQLDMILFGATGFTGRLAARYIAQQYNSDGGTLYKFGLAGRNMAKLQTLLMDELVKIDENAEERFELIVCDCHSTADVEAMVRRTSCVVTTVGPFAKYGERVISACCKYGVDYVDICAEYFWVRRMINKYDAKAKRSSARIVNFGGFISALTDCCIFGAAEYLKNNKGYDVENDSLEIQHACIPSKNSNQSVGTIESTFYAMEDLTAQNSDIRDSYYLKPDTCEYGPKQPCIQYPSWNARYKCYETPFLMYAFIERMIFIRSNMLLKYEYGRNVTVHASVAYIKSMFIAWIVALFVFAMPVISKYAIVKWLLGKLRRFLPQPGDGPSDEVMQDGHWRQFIHVRAKDAPDTKCVTVEVDVNGDYGYLNTAKLLVEQGMIFSDQRSNPKLRKIKGGFLTPAAAFGTTLISRMNQLPEFDIAFKTYDGRSEDNSKL